jgi:hypothetical protein
VPSKSRRRTEDIRSAFQSLIHSKFLRGAVVAIGVLVPSICLNDQCVLIFYLFSCICLASVTFVSARVPRRSATLLSRTDGNTPRSQPQSSKSEAKCLSPEGDSTQPQHATDDVPKAAKSKEHASVQKKTDETSLVAKPCVEDRALAIELAVKSSSQFSWADSDDASGSSGDETTALAADTLQATPSATPKGNTWWADIDSSDDEGTSPSWRRK